MNDRKGTNRSRWWEVVFYMLLVVMKEKKGYQLDADTPAWLPPDTICSRYEFETFSQGKELE